MLNSARPVSPPGGQARAEHGRRSPGARAAGPQGPRRRGRRPVVAALLGARRPGRGFRRSGACRCTARRGARSRGRPGRAPGTLLEFTCLVPANFSILERMALLVQRQLGEVDVRMRAGVAAARRFNRRIVSGDFDAVMLSILGGPCATVFHRFVALPRRHRPAGTSGAIATPRVDAALDAALDARRRRGIQRAPSGGSKRRCGTIRRRCSSPGTRRCRP